MTPTSQLCGEQCRRTEHSAPIKYSCPHWPNSQWPHIKELWANDPNSGTSDLGPIWARLARNATNPGLFHIRFQYILAQGANLKKSQIFSISGQCDPIWRKPDMTAPNLLVARRLFSTKVWRGDKGVITDGGPTPVKWAGVFHYHVHHLARVMSWVGWLKKRESYEAEQCYSK